MKHPLRLATSFDRQEDISNWLEDVLTGFFNSHGKHSEVSQDMAETLFFRCS